MASYFITTHDLTGQNLVMRRVFGSTLTIENPVITGGGTSTSTPGGPGSTTPAAVGYLWPRGDGTPAAT